MKRTLSMLLVLAMLLSYLPFTARATSDPKYTSLLLDINWDHIEEVGKQDFKGKACACYALAYCRTMLDGKVHEWYEYNKKQSKDEFNNVSCQWPAGDYTKYKNKDKAATFRKLYNELCKGNPTVALVNTVGKTNTHYVAVVGFTDVTDLDSLSEKNFLVLDPGRNPHKIFNMSDTRELRRNSETLVYSLYPDTSSATVTFTAEPYVSEPIVTEPIVTEPIVTEPPVIEDGKWPTPTGLRWGYTVEYGVDENGTFNGEINVVPGRPTDITFKAHADASYAIVTLYREAGDNDVRINSRYVSCYDGYAYDPYLAGTPELETGDYYFTVSIYGRGDYADSEIATSDVWHYTKPSAQLAAPTDLTWNGTKISCTLNGDTSHLGGYSVAWYYGATADVEPTGAGSLQSVNLDTAPLSEVDLQNDPSFLMSKNIGYYYYKLELYSDDVTVIRNSEETSYSEALYFDGTNFEIRPGYTPDVPPAVEDGRIGTPYDLQWGYGVAFNNQGGSRYPSASFHASWKIDPLNHGEEYEISVYKENGDNDILVGSYSSNYSYSTVYKYAESRYAGTLDLETGDYYFTVMSYKRKDNWIDRDVSDVAVSPVWHYTKPDSKIETCTNPTWNWPEDNLFTSSNLDGDTPTANWKYPDDPNVDGYHVQWYYSKTNGGELQYLYDSWVHWKNESATFGSIYEHNGAGYYYFKVRALSEDTSKICNGDYVLSAPCYFDGEKGSTQLPTEPHTHEWDDGKVTKEPTTTEEGVKTYTCTSCGETKTESIPVVPDNLWQDEWGDWYFSDFEGLKILCSQTYEMDTYAYCNVSEALMILENLTIPSMLHVEIYDAPVTVPAGVSLTMEDGSFMMVRSMEVGGTADVFNLSVYESLDITGSVNCCESVWLADGATLSGRDKITFSREYAQITYMKAVTDTASLKAVLTVIENNTDPRVRYNLTFQGDVVINESVTLPTDCNIIMASESVTVASGAVLTVEGYLDISCPVTINGELVNNQRISLNVYDWSSAHLTIADAGKYSGNGVLVVQSDTLTEPKEAVTGLNWADFEITEHNDWNHFWQIRNAAGLIKLATPTNLEWGTRHNIWSGWDEEKQEPIYTTEAFPGAMSWKPAEPTQGHAIIKVYRADDNTQVDFHSWRFSSTELPEWRSVESFAMSNPESGTYYFTVTAEGDYTQYRNSDTATSPNWTYTKPDAKLGTCTNLSWDWPHASFTYNGDKTYYGGQEFQILFSATENGEPTTYSWSWGYDPSEILGVWDEVMMECGVGYYYFKVRALSSDITKACNGEWSELSPAYNLTEVVENMSGQLNNILQDSENLTDEEVREAVQELDTQKLKDSLLAEDSVQQQIAILEEQVGGPAEVAVSNEVAMDANEISVVGANLNNAASADEDIKLVIDKPEEEHVLAASFDNSVAFKFSMTLDNVEDAKNLDVPVRITMPVPAGVNPNFLVILHYHADGTREEIGPAQYNISGNGDKLYVSFVVTSFSDFVITQYKQECNHVEVIDAKVEPTCTEPGKTEGKHCSVCNEVLVAQEEIPATDHKWDNGKVTKEPTATEDGVKTFTCTACGETKEEPVPATGEEILWGDANGDGNVNTKDATRILRYYAELTPASEIDLIAADVNGDGNVNTKDATRILRYYADLIDSLVPEK